MQRNGLIVFVFLSSFLMFLTYKIHLFRMQLLKKQLHTRIFLNVSAERRPRYIIILASKPDWVYSMTTEQSYQHTNKLYLGKLAA